MQWIMFKQRHKTQRKRLNIKAKPAGLSSSRQTGGVDNDSATSAPDSTASSSTASLNASFHGGLSSPGDRLTPTPTTSSAKCSRPFRSKHHYTPTKNLYRTKSKSSSDLLTMLVRKTTGDDGVAHSTHVTASPSFLAPFARGGLLSRSTSNLLDAPSGATRTPDDRVKWWTELSTMWKAVGTTLQRANKNWFKPSSIWPKPERYVSRHCT
ncbi:Nuclear receptor coactivator 1 [Anopheles sinensis]|uniref:Nuclear receptor coactivator 1 n=1 Tax=Anopheles sinensis TaxID=74873 RepID=A0A084VF69_ANOSI|nr:Nuclear receptor coactivator 1 [Anopheles sinensis]